MHYPWAILLLACLLLGPIAGCSTTTGRSLEIVNSPTVGCQHLWEEPGYPGHDDSR